MTDGGLPDEVLLVLGMHRSGTSFVAGALDRSGITFADCNRSAGKHNRAGNFEHQQLVLLHEVVLRQSGGSWRSPPDAVDATPEVVGRLRGRLAPYGSEPRFACKDPRTLLLLNLWRSLDVPLTRVGVFRHPAAVAASLSRRDDLSVDEGLDLWMRYNDALLDEWERSPFPVVDFDLPIEQLAAKVTAVAADLGAADPAAAGASFTDDLRSASDPPGELPGPVQERLDRLRSLAT